MSTKPINFENIELNKITFTKVKQNKYGGNLVNILYDGKPNPVFIFPKMKVPFGIGKMEDLKTPGVFKYSLDLSLDNKSQEFDIDNVYQKVKEFDEYILKSAVKFHKEWLNEEEKPDLKLVKKLYNSTIKMSIDKVTKQPKDYDYRIKGGIFIRSGGEFSFTSFNSKKERIVITKDNYMSYVSPGDMVKTLMCPRQVWFMSTGSFGVSWDVKQMLIHKGQNSMDVCQIGSDCDTDDEASDSEGSEC